MQKSSRTKKKAPARARVRHAVTPNQRLLTIPQAADELGLQEVTIWHKVYNRQIESVKIGRARRIPRSAIERIIEHGTTPADRRFAVA